ncbi:hypothetical protein [Bergeyella sp. RCAD1439]|nr:hypothetical protein [Bergeyella sp. RCAD1439]
MKKNDTLKRKTLKPHPKTIDFLLRFSKAVTVLDGRFGQALVSKN